MQASQISITPIQRWILLIFTFLISVMSLFRVIFHLQYHPANANWNNLLEPFLLGLRFDARVLAIVLLPLIILAGFKKINPFNNGAAHKWWTAYLALAITALVLFYGFDYYYYAYLTQRLNGNILNFLDDAGISFQMMWQSYPLLRLVLLLLIIIALLTWVTYKLFQFSSTQTPIRKKKRLFTFLIVFIFLGFCIYGKAGRFPLRWSDAFTLGNTYQSNLALNPIQSFFSTLNFRRSEFDLKTVKKHYPMMADYFGVENPKKDLDFSRSVIYNPVDSKPVNVVLVICESFSAYKSSMWGNPLNTTPFFDSLSKQGIFYDRHFTPHYGTARGIWATITGIPDVQLIKTASRNPQAVDQHTIINDFKGYEKFYFLGGSASWANIRGVITNNIRDVKLYEEEDYDVPAVDVWGISDLNLFKEANKVLGQQEKPFFAIIQTANNHRPYTIPEEDKKDFKIIENISIDTLNKYGFESLDEYNAFRYTDFTFQEFMKAAQKETYFDNTMFVFVGDHGIRCKQPLTQFPAAWVDEGLACEHVPLLFYHNGKLQPKRTDIISSQVDILPTIAGLLQVPYTNSGMGADLSKSDGTNNFAFIIDHDTRQIGVLHKDYFYTRGISSKKESFVSTVDNIKIPKNEYFDSIRLNMSKMTEAWYHTAHYLLLNNKSK